MAGPSVVVRVLGDLTGLGKSLSGVEAKGASTSSKLRAGFKGMFSALNATGVLGPVAELFDQLDQGFDGLEEHKKKFGDIASVVGGVAAGAGAILSTLGSAEAEASSQLKSAIAGSGHSYAEYRDQIEQTIKQQEKFGNSSVETQDALKALTNATGDPTTAIKDMGLAANLAASQHESLATAATQLGKVYNGSSRVLKQFGIATLPTVKQATKEVATATNAMASSSASLQAAQLRLQTVQDSYAGKTHLTALEQDRLTAAQAAVATASGKVHDATVRMTIAQGDAKTAATGSATELAQLSTKLKGQASDAANTFTGRLKAIRTEIEDQVAQFGAKYGPAITGAGAALGVLGQGVKTTQALMEAFRGTTEAMTAATEAGTAATEAATAAEDATAVSEGLALAPILLITAAVAALGIGIYELVTHWKVVWAAIQDAVSAVWDWIKKNWPLLVDIILGPIGIIATQVAQHWAAITAAFTGAFTAIKTAAEDAIGWVSSHVGDIVKTITGLPARITAAAKGMFDGIWHAFRDAINHVIDLWNKLHLTLPKIKLPFGLGHFGGETFKVPQIPHLAQGGLITQTGLVYAHAGEAITPAPGGAGGPALHIEHANFTEPVDLDLLMKKLEFALTAGLPV